MGLTSGWLSIAAVLLGVTAANAQVSETVERRSAPAVPAAREQANARLPSSSPPGAAKAAAEQAGREPPETEQEYTSVDLADTQVSNYKTGSSGRLPEAATGAAVPVRDVRIPAEVDGGMPAEPVRPAGTPKEPARLRERGRVYSPATECIEATVDGSRAPSSGEEAAPVTAGKCQRR